KLGTRAEIKNLNSFNSIMRAIEYEKKRQIKEIESGGTIVQETRGYDDEKRTTHSMREKEDAMDYRYFPDPDLMPIVIDGKRVIDIKNNLPELPEDRKNMYMEKYDLSSYDAEQLISSKEVADYFEESVEEVKTPKILANIMIGEIFSISSPDDFHIKISPKDLGELVVFLENDTINNNSAKQVIKIMNETGDAPEKIIKEKGLEQIGSREKLEPIIDEVFLTSEKAIKEYKAGKKKALQSIIGKVMRDTKGRANPEMTKNILEEKIKEIE
ncbi:MAG: Asp-tRNA(Asn)/Glu-tRNA(Gln) amidotransferase subunit GatB, partial [Tissierella sp.]